MSLTDRELSFVTCYLISGNAARAAQENGYAPNYGRRLRWRADIAAAIASGQAERAARLGVEKDEVLQALARIAFSDASELIEHRRVACRCCHGRDHHRQFTRSELLERHDRGIDPVDPNHAGVYDPWADPNIDCPECGGLGEVATFVRDSRFLSPEGRALFAGVKQTARGPQVVAHDKVKALLQLGRHLGLFDRNSGKSGRGRTDYAALLRSLDEGNEKRAREAASADTIAP